MGLKKISEHFLVPKHEVVPKERVQEVLQKYGTSIEKLPKILSDDPAIEETGGKPGDIIKITRKSITAGRAVYFRVVA